MSCCKYCHNIVNYQLFEKVIFYSCKKYYFFNSCYECKCLIEDMFLLKLKADKEQADFEDEMNLQPF